MKTRLLLTTLLTTLLFSIQSRSQDVIHQSSCSDPYIIHEADSVKQELIKKGFIIVREASMEIESEYEMPVIVPLTQGSWYQFVFIGDYSSRLYEVRMYDWNEKEVIFRQNKWG